MKNNKNTKPNCWILCNILLKNGCIYHAVWVDRINKYIKCCKWRRPEDGLSKKQRWIDDSEVVEWEVIQQ